MNTLIDPFRIDGKTALITGAAAGGVGFHTAAALGRQGARLVISDCNESGLEDSRKCLETLGYDVSAVPADVTDETSVNHLVASIQDPLHVLVHHAGMNLRKGSHETTLEEWNKVLSVNITGTWLTARAAASAMAEGGTIITTGSVYTNIVGPIPEPAYFASKGATANLTRGLAAEFAHAGITVNCVAPGTFYPTKMTAGLNERPDKLAEMTNRTMLGRLGDPEQDLGGVVAFLASPAAGYITGQTIFVDGGWTAW